MAWALDQLAGVVTGGQHASVWGWVRVWLPEAEAHRALDNPGMLAVLHQGGTRHAQVDGRQVEVRLAYGHQEFSDSLRVDMTTGQYELLIAPAHLSETEGEVYRALRAGDMQLEREAAAVAARGVLTPHRGAG
jgi:hypothetical protein